jgi:hypothetical protein
VLLRHDRAAEPQTLATGGLDEPARGVVGRVGEHGSRVLTSGLVLAAPAHDLVDAFGTRRRIVVPAGELGTEHDRAGSQGRLPVAEARTRRGADPGTRRRRDR